MKSASQINILFLNTWPNKGGSQLCSYDIASHLNKDFNSIFCSMFFGPFLSLCEEKGFKTIKISHT